MINLNFYLNILKLKILKKLTILLINDKLRPLQP